MRSQWRTKLARTLRDLAYRLDPPSKPGPRKRKARTEAAAPPLFEINPNDPPSGYEIGSGMPHGFPQEIEEPRA